MLIKQAVNDTYNWAKEDYHSYPFRFCIEVLAWAISIGCTLTMAITVPNPPLIPLYAAWIIGCSMYAWSSWTRGSFGMLANYLLLTLIDFAGLIKMLTH